MPHSIKIRGIAPPELGTLPEPLRRQFWQLVTPIALKVKDAELAAGLDAQGEPLKPISARTRKYRRSAMTPSGKGDPGAPPLMPAYQKSRVRSLLAGRAFATHAELYWRYDPFTGASFDEILTYQKARGRDVFGLSAEAMAEVKSQSWAAWAKWRKTGLAPTEKRSAFPSAALEAGPQPRIAGIIARSAEPNAGATAPKAVGSMSTRWITRGIDAPKVAELKASTTRSGAMTGPEWRRFFTAEEGPTKPPPKPKAPRPKAPRPAPVVKLTPLERIRRQVEQARENQALIHNRAGSPIPHLIDPTAPIGDRIKAYTLGDAKIKAIIEYQDIIAKENDKTIRKLEGEYAALQVRAAKQNKAWHKLVAEFDKALQRGNQVKMEQLAPRVDEAMGRLIDTRKAYDAIYAQINELRQSARKCLQAIRLDKSESVAFHAISSEAGATSKEGPLHPINTDKDRKTADDAMEWLGRLVLKGSDGQWTDVVQIKVGVGPGYRAHHRHETAGNALYHVQIREGETVSTVIHEYGHGIDARISTGSTIIGKRSVEFLNHRVGQEKLAKLQDLFPDCKYNDDEYGRGDDFAKAQKDSKRSAFYTGKQYGGDSSEILSMGLECLYRDPVNFAKTDPEWFKYVVGILDGSLR